MLPRMTPTAGSDLTGRREHNGRQTRAGMLKKQAAPMSGLLF